MDFFGFFPEEEDLVEIPVIPCPLNEEQLYQLSRIDPLTSETNDYGIDVYLEALQLCESVLLV